MTLPFPPSNYSVLDQDRVRRILMEGLDSTIARLMGLEAIVVPPIDPEPTGPTALRIGHWNYSESIGKGPGQNLTPPIYTSVTDTSLSVSDVEGFIDKADEFDVQLVFAPSRNRGSYAPNGVFSRELYEDRTRQFDFPAFNDAVERERVLLMLGDEFNHPFFTVNGNGTCSAYDVNWMGNLHKQIWKNTSSGFVPLTFVRMSQSTLKSGWNGLGSAFPKDSSDLTSGFWTGLDYGWLQRASQHNPQGVQDYWDEGKAALLSVDLGMVPGFNWWAGGPDTASVDGISPCWDVNNDGTLNGLIVGEGGSDNAGHTQYQKIPCGTQAGLNRAVSSPDWIKHLADIACTDPDAPFVSVWTYPQPSSSVDHPTAIALATRADYNAAWDYAINKCNARAVFNGLRTAKPGDPV